LDKELRHLVQDAFYYKPPDPFWLMCFNCQKGEMNMVEEHVVIENEWISQGKLNELFNTIRSTITRSSHQGYTTQGQRGLNHIQMVIPHLI
jgi:hypothetical protein